MWYPICYLKQIGADIFGFPDVHSMLIKEKNPSSFRNVDVKDIDLWDVELNFDTLTKELVNNTLDK